MEANHMPAPSLGGGRLRVLVIESDPQSARVLAEALRDKSDYQAETACSLFHAGAMVQKYSPHVVLVDLMDRDIDTDDICGSIRRNQDFQTIKIIALANHLKQSEAAALMQKGFDDYVSNAGDINEITEKIEHTTAIVY